METIEIELDKIEHFSKVPEMKPFVGANYLSADKKILIIGESHFFDHEPKNEHPKCNTSPTVWYSYEEKIPAEKLEYINTRKSVKNPTHKFYQNLAAVLSENLKIEKSSVLENISFMNAFQRPANHRGVSMEVYAGEKDFVVSKNTILEVIKILKPNYVIFVSKYSWRKIGVNVKALVDCNIDFTSHPNSVEWSDSSNLDGKQKFVTILN